MAVCKYTCKDAASKPFVINALRRSPDVSTPRIYKILPFGASRLITASRLCTFPSADRASNPADVAAAAVARPTQYASRGKSKPSRIAPSTPCDEVKTTAANSPSGAGGDRYSGAISGAITGCIRAPNLWVSFRAKASPCACGRVSSTGTARSGSAKASDCLAMVMVLPAGGRPRNGRPWTGR